MPEVGDTTHISPPGSFELFLSTHVIFDSPVFANTNSAVLLSGFVMRYVRVCVEGTGTCVRASEDVKCIRIGIGESPLLEGACLSYWNNGIRACSHSTRLDDGTLHTVGREWVRGAVNVADAIDADSSV